MSSRTSRPATGALRPTARLRVTVICPYGTLGGAELWLLQMLDSTDRLDVDVVQLGRGDLDAELDRRGVSATYVATGPTPFDMVRASARIHALLRHAKPDVIVANGLKAAVVGIPAARVTGVPLVWAKHDHFHDENVGRWVARFADRVVATSPELASATGRHDAAVVSPPRRHQAPLDRDRARRVLGSYGIQFGDGPVLVMLGRVIPYKGIDDALRALTQATDWRLVVIGVDDPAEPGSTHRLAELAGSLGLGDRVQFAGYVADAADYLSAFDAAAMLTKLGDRAPAEGFGISAFEAVLAGLPVVITPGAPVLRHLGDAAIVVPAGDPSAVADALGSIRDRVGAARHVAEELRRTHPDERSAADEFVALLAETCCRPGAGRSDGLPVSVITTVRNEMSTIEGLVALLLPQLVSGDELIVVDGGSTDRTVELLDRHTGEGAALRVIEVAGATIADGRNIAVAAAKNGVIACTDSGCEPESNWLQGIRSAFAEPDPPSLLTGVYAVTGDSPLQRAMAVSNYPRIEEARGPSLFVRAYGRLFGGVFDAALPTGRSMAFSKDAFDRVGGFRETLAEVTIGQAVAGVGGRCVLSTDAAVSWRQRSSWRATVAMYWNYGYGDGGSGSKLLVARNVARALAVVFVCIAMVGALGSKGRRTAVLSGAMYLSLPTVRARRVGLSVQSVVLIPVALATKDLSKAAGCITALGVRCWRDVVGRRADVSRVR